MLLTLERGNSSGKKMQTWQLFLCGGEKKKKKKKNHQPSEECCLSSDGEGTGEQQCRAAGADGCLRMAAAAVTGFSAQRWPPHFWHWVQAAFPGIDLSYHSLLVCRLRDRFCSTAQTGARNCTGSTQFGSNAREHVEQCWQQLWASAHF